MRIYFVAVGQRMPDWVSQGYQEYHKRLPAAYQPVLKEIPAEKRSKSANSKQILQSEGTRILGAIPGRCYRVALERSGRQISTEQFATALQSWGNDSQDVAFLVGGPEGLSSDCLAQANEQWSLSAMTFPHPLVRILLIEQLYRAWSLLQNMPYHR